MRPPLWHTSDIPVTVGQEFLFVNNSIFHQECWLFFSVIDLVNKLEQEKEQGKSGNLAGRMTRVDFVILDELG
jgi:hypothetical protein